MEQWDCFRTPLARTTSCTAHLTRRPGGTLAVLCGCKQDCTHVFCAPLLYHPQLQWATSASLPVRSNRPGEPSPFVNLLTPAACLGSETAISSIAYSIWPSVGLVHQASGFVAFSVVLLSLWPVQILRRLLSVADPPTETLPQHALVHVWLASWGSLVGDGLRLDAAFTMRY